MPRLSAIAVASPFGGIDATLDALTRATDDPGVLDEPLPVTLARLLAEIGPVDRVLLATTKGDLPVWADAVLAGGHAGGPAHLARALGGTAVSGACASGPLALGEAARLVASGRARRVAVLGGDRLAPFVHGGFAALRAIDPGRCRPFDRGRRGLRLGESAAAILVTADGDGPWLSGWGASLDAHHLTGPARDGAGLVAACRMALDRAGIAAPAAVIAHGTGTPYNDAAEVCAYRTLCPDAPVTAWKGVLGHGLGGCGVVAVALAAAVLRDGRPLPGCAHLVDPEPGLRLLPSGAHAHRGPLLCASAGFGGVNGAVVIGAGAPRDLARAAPRLARRVELPCPLGALGARAVLGRIEPTWGRMDLPCRALTALAVAAGDLPEGTAIVLLTEAGSAASDRAFEAARRLGQEDPQRFAYTLPTTAIGEASIRRRLRGTGFALMGADDAEGRACAAGLLAEGAPAVLLARVEADAPPHTAWAEVWTL